MNVTCELPALVGTGETWEMDVVFPPRVGDIVQSKPGTPLDDYEVSAVVHRQIGNAPPIVVLRVRKAPKPHPIGGGAVRKDAAAVR